jgi:hypothetical protein
MLKSRNKLKVNRLANRQSESIKFASKPFIFSAENGSNHLYIALFGHRSTHHENRGNS